jgi:hypothetical protein
MAGAVLFILLSRLTGLYPSYDLLIGEVVAAVAFGTSWLFKGLELDVLWLARPRPAR